MTITDSTSAQSPSVQPTSGSSPRPIDEEALMAYAAHVGGQLAATTNAFLVGLGDTLGLWAGMADSRPTTSTALARRTGLSERLVREWLSSQAANGLVSYDAGPDEFLLSPEGALVLGSVESNASMLAPFRGLAGLVELMPRLADGFRSGSGVAWADHTDDFFDTQFEFSRPLLRELLVDVWLAAVPGLTEALTRGAVVADVGCGYGVSTILLAQAFPASTFVGFDFHDHSIARARAAALEADVADRVTFEVAGADSFAGSGYDIVLFVDSLHDMGDPVAALDHARSALAADGVVVTLDPIAADSLADNLAANPMAGLMYAISTFLCTPSALAQPGGQALGALAGERAIRQAFLDAGFIDARRVAPELPMNMVIVGRGRA